MKYSSKELEEKESASSVNIAFGVVDHSLFFFFYFDNSGFIGTSTTSRRANESTARTL